MTKSKLDFCLTCPKWGGDGLCFADGNLPAYDDPDEDYCIFSDIDDDEDYIEESDLCLGDGP